MTFFKRGFQGVKEIVGVSKKTIDDELKELKIEVQSMHKRLKKSSSDFAKLPESGRSATIAHMTALKSGMEVMAESSCYEECFTVFEALDSKASMYGVKLREEVIDPIKRLLEMLTTLEKRMRTLEQRRLDMDAASSKYQSISKKPIEKQHGLQEAETKFADAKDNYDYLRNEIVEDSKAALDEVKRQYPQICVNCMKSYTDYVNELNEIWARVPDIISSVEEYDLKMALPITPQEQSTVLVENVKAKKNSDMSSFVSDGFTSTTSTSKVPPTPTKQVQTHGTVTALYDYDATEPGELTFKEGDVITVFDNSGDWWTGELNGVKGVFPSNYVQK